MTSLVPSELFRLLTNLNIFSADVCTLFFTYVFSCGGGTDCWDKEKEHRSCPRCEDLLCVGNLFLCYHPKQLAYLKMCLREVRRHEECGNTFTCHFCKIEIPYCDEHKTQSLMICGHNVCSRCRFQCPECNLTFCSSCQKTCDLCTRRALCASCSQNHRSCFPLNYLGHFAQDPEIFYELFE
jgi:hypothetical protein